MGPADPTGSDPQPQTLTRPAPRATSPNTPTPGRTVIAFDQPYNRHLPPPRAATWEEAESLIYDHLAAHQGTVQHQLPTFDPSTNRLDRRTN